MPPSSPILGIRASQVVVYVVCLCVRCCLCPCQGQTCPNLSPDGDVTRALPPVSCLWLGKQGPRDLSLAPHWATQLSELKLPSPVANRPNFPRLSRTFPIGGLIASPKGLTRHLQRAKSLGGGDDPSCGEGMVIIKRARVWNSGFAGTYVLLTAVIACVILRPRGSTPRAAVPFCPAHTSH